MTDLWRRHVARRWRRHVRTFSARYPRLVGWLACRRGTRASSPPFVVSFWSRDPRGSGLSSRALTADEWRRAGDPRPVEDIWTESGRARGWRVSRDELRRMLRP